MMNKFREKKFKDGRHTSSFNISNILDIYLDSLKLKELLIVLPPSKQQDHQVCFWSVSIAYQIHLLIRNNNPIANWTRNRVPFVPEPGLLFCLVEWSDWLGIGIEWPLPDTGGYIRSEDKTLKKQNLCHLCGSVCGFCSLVVFMTSKYARWIYYK